MNNYTKILIPTQPHADTVVAIFLLKSFGTEKYSGIENASVETSPQAPEGESADSLMQKGIFPLDLEGGQFDHHGSDTTASELVAKDLGIADSPALTKLLAYAERDDKYGAGTLSQDPIDKAFGLSGLIFMLNRAHPEDPNETVDAVFPLLHAYYLEEYRRTEDLPREFEEKLQNGKAEQVEVRHKRQKTKIVFIESDSHSIVGWLRASSGAKADVVVQHTSAGYVNILTRQFKRIDLRLVTSLIREEELRARGESRQIPVNVLTNPGRIQEVPDWYYDRATNSILNGSVNPKGVSPTKIPFEALKKLVTRGLEELVIQKNTRPPRA